MSTTVVKSWVSKASIGTVNRHADDTWSVTWIHIGQDGQRETVEYCFDQFPIAYLATLEEAGIAPPCSDMINRGS